MTKGNEMTNEQTKEELKEFKRNVVVPILQGLLASGIYEGKRCDAAVKDALNIAVELDREIARRVADNMERIEQEERRMNEHEER